MAPLRPALLLALLALPAAGQSAPHYGGDPTRPAPLREKPEQTLVVPAHRPRTLQVKFAEGSETRLRPGGFEGTRVELGAVNSLLLEWSAAPRRMFVQTEDQLADWVASGEARSGIQLHDLNLFYFVDLQTDGQVALLCDALNELDVVELAWPTPTGGDPVAPACPAPAAAPRLGGTPNFEGLQGYRKAAPQGVDALYGNTFSGGSGAGLTVIDCETGWTDDHEDLKNKLEDQWVLWVPSNNPWNHGTAVMGEIVGEANNFGVRGIAYGADALLSTHTPVGMSQNIPGSISNAAFAAEPGDAIVIEIQCFDGPPSPHPCEYDPATFATVQAATANGVHVFAAAGNGSNDLSSPAYGGAFDFAVKDSGSILVGATDGASLFAAGFSNYGPRCTSSGWGEDVVTTAYGDLQGGAAQQHYTAVFSGTSSATPIVTGAGVILATMHREAFGHDLSPLELRFLLAVTGTPWEGAKQVGTRPDVRSAVRELGIPELGVGGLLTPGGTLELSHWGSAGDVYFLLASPGKLATPLSLPPWGDLFLDPAGILLFPAQSVLGPMGTAVDAYPLPNSPSLAGKILFFQSGHGFLSQPGVGSFSNWVNVRIQ